MFMELVCSVLYRILVSFVQVGIWVIFNWKLLQSRKSVLIMFCMIFGSIVQIDVALLLTLLNN